MNIAGPVAATLFILTALTVIGALISYAIFRARERTRAKSRNPGGPMVLEFFVEYQLPTAGGGVAHDRLSHTVRGGRSFWSALLTWFVLVGGAGGGVWFYYYVLNRDAGKTSNGSGSGSAAAGAAKGIGSRGSGSGGGGAANAGKNKAPPAVHRPARRGPQRPLPSLLTRAASKFPRAGFDKNGDGKISRAERLRIWRRVPQFVLVSVNDGVAAEGLRFLERVLDQRDIWRHTTLFLSGKQLPADKGAPLRALWQSAADRSALGVSVGARGKRAGKAIAAAASASLGKLSTLVPPAGWRWSAYGWGARAAKLSVDRHYFAGLMAAKPALGYDSSLVVQPLAIAPPRRRRRRGRRGGVGAGRDLPWPFSLSLPPPSELMLPAAAGGKKPVKIGRPEVFEVPLAAWRLRAKGKTSWQPPSDQRLWALHGCSGATANGAAVRDVLRNLRAHLVGNRAPFSLMLQPESYLATRACQRATLVAILDGVRRLVDQGYNIRYVSIPELLRWLAASP